MTEIHYTASGRYHSSRPNFSEVDKGQKVTELPTFVKEMDFASLEKRVAEALEEKTCENCGFGPRQIVEGCSCDSFCSIMNDPRQDCLWEPKNEEK